MRPHNPHERAGPRRTRPALEALESRDLMTAQPLASVVSASFPGGHPPAADVQQFVPVLYPPGTPQPNEREIQRESFVVKAVGRYTLGPGRFNTQAITIHGFGKSSRSNVSL